MAKGYWIAHVDVTDLEGYKDYQAANAVAFRKYGARYVVRAGRHEAVEGACRPRLVVIEFADYDTALACYRSPEYQHALTLRQGHAVADIVVVDCLTLWQSNLLLADATDEAVFAAVDELIDVLRERRCSVILVTNEVGMGIVPETPLGRRFRDLSGTLHQRIAAVADEVYLGVLGVMLRIKPIVGSVEP